MPRRWNSDRSTPPSNSPPRQADEPRPSPHAYTDEALFLRELGGLASIGAHYVGPIEGLGSPGRYRAISIGAAQLALIVDRSGELRCISNSCLHRGAELVHGDGTAMRIQCPYHGWQYSLDGALQSPSIPGSSCSRLNSLPLTCAGPLVLVGDLPASRSPDDLAAELRSCFDTILPSADSTPVRQTYSVRANWKLIVENFLECYHCPFVHKDTLAQAVDLSSYVIEVDPEIYVHRIAPRSEVDSRAPRSARVVYFLFPATAISVSDDFLATFTVMPQAPDRSLVVRDFYRRTGEPPPTEYFERVMLEDIRICESVQRSMQSPYARVHCGTTPEEAAVAAFHRDYLRWLDSGSRSER